MYMKFATLSILLLSISSEIIKHVDDYTAVQNDIQFLTIDQVRKLIYNLSSIIGYQQHFRHYHWKSKCKH
jgi:hypothetical protein